MSQVCILLVMLNFVSIYGYPGETLMYLPPFEIRTADRYPFTQFQDDRDLHGQQPTLHTNLDQRQLQQTTEKPNENITLNDLIGAFNEVRDSQHIMHRESQKYRAAAALRDGNDSTYRPYPGPYPRPSTPGYGTSPGYQNPPPAPPPPTPLLPKLPLLKPDLSDLFKPVSTKVASKVSGLLGIILTLLSGSAPVGLQEDGLKGLVIDGILKPLLVAKGGIKSLISKLLVPIIALVLINVEVLITVWWLWEECPVEKAPAPVPNYSYQKPQKAYNYNNYNSYQ